LNAFLALLRSCHIRHPEPHETDTDVRTEALNAKRSALPFYAALPLAASIGFISLSYEVVWYRIYSFASWS